MGRYDRRGEGVDRRAVRGPRVPLTWWDRQTGPRIAVGNKREVPPSLPPMEWMKRVENLVHGPHPLDIPWYNPAMEYLSPEELRRVKAKALIWATETGEWPKEIAWWWELRLARRRGDLPHTDERVTARIDAQGVLHCGQEECGARWSKNYDGTPHPDRCKLCDRLWDVEVDEREVLTV